MAPNQNDFAAPPPYSPRIRRWSRSSALFTSQGNVFFLPFADLPIQFSSESLLAVGSPTCHCPSPLFQNKLSLCSLQNAQPNRITMRIYRGIRAISLFSTCRSTAREEKPDTLSAFFSTSFLSSNAWQGPECSDPFARHKRPGPILTGHRATSPPNSNLLFAPKTLFSPTSRALQRCPFAQCVFIPPKKTLSRAMSRPSFMSVVNGKANSIHETESPDLHFLKWVAVQLGKHLKPNLPELALGLGRWRISLIRSCLLAPPSGLCQPARPAVFKIFRFFHLLRHLVSCGKEKPWNP